MYPLDTQSKIYQLDTQSISIHLTHSHWESSNGLDTQSISIHLTHSHWESSNGLDTVDFYTMDVNFIML
jgi:hypothetical protein